MPWSDLPRSLPTRLTAPLLMRMADALPWPLVALAADGRCLGANRAGEHALVDGRVLRRDAQGRVVASEPARRAAWALALEQAAAGEVVPLQWTGRRRTLRGVLKRLPSGAGAVALMLTLSAPGAGGQDLGAYAQGHGLSPAETRVLVLLADGLDTAAMATELGIAASTVRKHLLSLRRKTGHARTSGLLLEVGRLPPRLSLPM